MLKMKPVVLLVHNVSYIVGVSGNQDNSDTRVGLRNIAAPFLHYSLTYGVVDFIVNVPCFLKTLVTELNVPYAYSLLT